MKQEDSLQIAVMSYIRLQYPDVLAFHVANERKTSPMAGAKLKKKGVLAGVADVLIFRYKENPGNFEKHPQRCGLAIELKVGKNKQTPSQLKFQQMITAEKWQYHVCYDFDTAREIIDKYLS